MREISLHLMDIIQNSIDAKASLIEIQVLEDTFKNRMRIIVSDNGKGISPEMIEKIKDPFVTSRISRKVGLGLSLFESACERCGGFLNISSQVNIGTEVIAEMQLTHIDRAPLGRIEDTIASSLLTPGIDLVYRHVHDGAEFNFNTKEIKKVVGEDINHPEILQWIREYIVEGIVNIGTTAI